MKRKHLLAHLSFAPTVRDIGITFAVLVLVTGLGFLLDQFGFTEANIITVYILGVLLTALFTRNSFCSVLSSAASVLLFNFFFAVPLLDFRAYETGYPITFAITLIAALITSSMAKRLDENARQKEEAAAQIKNEQLRADLLRSISHDLRTPLTSISGNAENLLNNRQTMDDATQEATLTDIYEDAIWLNQLVENLLAITRIGEDRTRLNLSTELVEDVITEALRHIRSRSRDHIIKTELPDELLLAQMDARLISQVIINLVDNALKYTPAGSVIRICAQKQERRIVLCVADNGPGIADKQKPKVFDMFYTGENKIADHRRSMGLGLALCKSILALHGGEITLTDNVPQGCVFTFTLPASEVVINE